MAARRTIRAVLAGLVVVLLILSTVSFVRWRQESREIRRLLSARIEENAAPSEIVAGAFEFMKEEVGYGRHGSYFLLPVFRFMRPTALQVIREGGDCAYRTRAFVVILHLFDVEARKLALYDDHGNPIHTVAEVETPEGPRYFDLLYNIAHRGADGGALDLAQLADEQLLRASLQRAIAEGNELARGYPVHLYDFEDVRTLNWKKNALTEIAYAGLAGLLGEERADALPRPYLSEEPALMVIAICLATSLLLLVVIFVLRPRPAAGRT